MDSAHRKTVGKQTVEEEIVDFGPLTGSYGVTLLKFGNRGPAREKVFHLSKDKRLLMWQSQWFCHKFGSTNRIDMEKVQRIQRGQKTYQFERMKHIYGVADEKSLSIIYNDDRGRERSLNVICPNKEGFKYVFKALRSITQEIQEEKKNISLDKQYLKKMWGTADKDHNGSLSRDEIFALISFMNVHMSMKLVKEMFKRVDIDNSGTLSYPEFVNFMEILRKRPDLDSVWSLIVNGESLRLNFNAPLSITVLDASDKKQLISLNHFIRFWGETQGEVIGETVASEMVAEFNPDYLLSNDEPGIGNYLWSQIMAGHDNDVMSKAKKTVYQDLTQPLSHYFIDTSHCTYLEGNQMTGRVSVQRYVDDLLTGTRCVHVRVWDGDKDPFVYHTHSAVKITYADVLRAIAEHGFENNELPIIINLENHCSMKQQQRVAQLSREILKDLLAVPAPGSSRLPSPADLLRKVVFSGVRADSVRGDENPDEDEAELREEADAVQEAQSKVSTQKIVTNIHPELSSLFYLCSAKSVNRYDSSGNLQVNRDVVWHVGEVSAKGLIASPDNCIKHNESHLSHVFPKSSRLDSSNYDPSLGWISGHSFVALNQQTTDLYYHVNKGRFRDNGSCGYVLKPEYMLGRAAEPFPPVRLLVNVLSAHQLPKPKNSTHGEVIDPFCVVNINGAPQDNARFQTATILDNGFNPLWNELFTFDITRPELAVLSIEIFDEDVTTSEFIAFSSYPVTCMRPGIRSCQLFDERGRMETDFAFASLTVRICFEPLSTIR